MKLCLCYYPKHSKYRRHINNFWNTESQGKFFAVIIAVAHRRHVSLKCLFQSINSLGFSTELAAAFLCGSICSGHLTPATPAMVALVITRSCRKSISQESLKFVSFKWPLYFKVCLSSLSCMHYNGR